MQTPSRFFGGEASSLGQVSRLSVSSWPRFVQEVLGHPAIVNVTREQFAAMSPKARHAAKRVPYVTPATFRSDTSRRLTEYAQDIALIALDIDDPAQARPFARQPELLSIALEPLAFAAYTTASSTTEAPKLRIFVAADHLPVSSYAAAVRTVAKALGLPSVTKESLVPVQPMYLPTLFRDDDPVDCHPLLIGVTKGQPLRLADVKTATVPTGERADDEAGDDKSGDDTPDAVAADLEHLRPAVEGITLDDVREALAHVDPDLPYPEWLEVAAALRHQFTTKDDREAAYLLFDKWSAKGDKYASKADTRAKWDSLRPTPRGRAPVTVRSLLLRATEGGWDGAPALAGRMYQSVLTWLSDPARTQHELMTGGIRRIASAPLQSPVERDTLLSRLRDALLLRNLKVSHSALRKELFRLERSTDRPTANKPEADVQLPKWARGICYVAGANEFYQRVSDRRFNPEVLDNVFSVHLMPPESDSGRPAMRPRDYLLNVARVPRVEHYRYDPSHPEQTFVQDGGHRFVNVYLPTYPEPDPDSADEAGEVFYAHLKHLIAEPEYRSTLLDYLAFCVQHPGAKIRWTVLLQGAQGCGKTAVAEAMRAVLGESNVAIMDASLLFSPFNGWATGRQLVALEEVRVVGHNRHEVMNRLKPCISNDTLVINRKHCDLQHVPNNANYLMFTNHHDSLAVNDDDRRYFVLNAALQNRAQVRELGRKYFSRLFHTINKCSAGLRAWLEAHEISEEFDPNGPAPQTRYLHDLTNAAATPLTAAVKDALEDGDHPLVKPDLLTTKALKNILQGENLPRFTDQQLATALRELDYVQVGRPRLEDGRHYVWAKRGRYTPKKAEALVRERSGNRSVDELL